MRQCAANAGSAATWTFWDLQFCGLGKCSDCGGLSGASATTCQASCGLENFCGTAIEQCKAENDCRAIMACHYSCGTLECQADCAAQFPSVVTRTLWKAVTDCEAANATEGCAAP